MTSLAKEIPAADFIPWRALRVEWADGSEDFTDINPWDVDSPTGAFSFSNSAVPTGLGMSDAKSGGKKK